MGVEHSVSQRRYPKKGRWVGPCVPKNTKWEESEKVAKRKDHQSNVEKSLL